MGTVRLLSNRALSPFMRGNEDSMYIKSSVSESYLRKSSVNSVTIRTHYYEELRRDYTFC